MAQTTKWLMAILDYMKDAMSNISESHSCLGSIPNLSRQKLKLMVPLGLILVKDSQLQLISRLLGQP